MSVYVDEAVWPFGRMIMCHMMADTEDELHAMADALGLRREWFQGDHYDISKGKRREAVKLGALEVSSVELVRRFRLTAQGSGEKQGG